MPSDMMMPQDSMLTCSCRFNNGEERVEVVSGIGAPSKSSRRGAPAMARKVDARSVCEVTA